MGMCDDYRAFFKKREKSAITKQLYRAQIEGLPHTLTLGEWLETLDEYLWRCAYCMGPYQVIEHFVPVSRGGGTTKWNCVPACVACNNRKRDRHPVLEENPDMPLGSLYYVSEYLEQFLPDGGDDVVYSWTMESQRVGGFAAKAFWR